jgi:hypothetical protein
MGSARVKWRGKSSPPWRQHQGHGKPHPKQNQAVPSGAARFAGRKAGTGQVGRKDSGGDVGTREMAILDRTRLTGHPKFPKKQNPKQYQISNTNHPSPLPSPFLRKRNKVRVLYLRLLSKVGVYIIDRTMYFMYSFSRSHDRMDKKK